MTINASSNRQADNSHHSHKNNISQKKQAFKEKHVFEVDKDFTKKYGWVTGLVYSRLAHFILYNQENRKEVVHINGTYWSYGTTRGINKVLENPGHHKVERALALLVREGIFERAYLDPKNPRVSYFTFGPNASKHHLEKFNAPTPQECGVHLIRELEGQGPPKGEHGPVLNKSLKIDTGLGPLDGPSPLSWEEGGEQINPKAQEEYDGRLSLEFLELQKEENDRLNLMRNRELGVRTAARAVFTI